jgi:prepilin-type N-terminal cleavage/methylation domain-containing protein
VTARGPRTAQRGWTILEVLIVLALIGLLLALALPNFHAARIRNDEAAAVRTLREIARAQAMVRRAALVDVDSDGRGEHALLAELSGEKNPRTFSGSSGGRPAALPQFALKVSPEGEGEICGYRFRVYLPGPRGVAVAEEGGEPSGAVDPRLAAEVWCAYAWPSRIEGFVPAATGKRTFFANQAGEVLAADAAYTAIPERDGEPSRPPRPGAAFQPPGSLETITGPPAVGTLGRDGLLWRTVR